VFERTSTEREREREREREGLSEVRKQGRLGMRRSVQSKG